MAARRARFKRVPTEIDGGALAGLRRPIERLMKAMEPYRFGQVLWDPDLTEVQRLDLVRSLSSSFDRWLLGVVRASGELQKAVKRAEGEVWLRRQLEGLGEGRS